MKNIDTLGDEQLLVARHGAWAVAIAVTHPHFGRIATVHIDHEQAAELMYALRDIGLRDGEASASS